MTFFEVLSNTFHTKKVNELDQEGLGFFNGYMISRWLSFYSDNQCIFVNETLNKFGYIFQDKQQQYRLFFNLIPRLRFKKIQYIKKKKEQQEKEEKLPMVQVARQMFMSVKELQQYVDLAKTITN